MDRHDGIPAEDVLLSREDFREFAFRRDGHRCVVCSAPAVDAHHVMERRLFPDGGYYLGNAASVCEEHHRECERTRLSVEEIRALAGIRTVILPPHLYADEGPYTKWGDPILADGHRLRGELFWDGSVQRVLREGGVLDRYLRRTKYPRTFHVPFSDGVLDDDRVLASLTAFEGRGIVVTEKRDGENTMIYDDGYVHARSVDGPHHPSQTRVRRLGAEVSAGIPRGWRISGENLQSTHTIGYRHLRAYFEVFGVWDERDRALPWPDVVEWADMLDLRTVPVLYEGPFDPAILRSLHRDVGMDGDDAEGWVMRVVDGFPAHEFAHRVAKYVRAGHRREHGRQWRRGPISENAVAEAP